MNISDDHDDSIVGLVVLYIGVEFGTGCFFYKVDIVKVE